jgi:endonuclease/exonuclease/phosphatase (EEP) superfamily protein YafD
MGGGVPDERRRPASTIVRMRRQLDDLWDLSCIAMPAVAVVAAPAAVVAGAVGAWWAAAPLAVAAAGSLAFTAWPRRRMRASPPTDGVRIVAANLWYKNRAMDEAARQILALSPDVVVISELGQAAHDVLVDAFPHHDVLAIGGPRGHAVFSRFPLERLEQPPVIGPVLRVRVLAPAPFELFAAHLPRATMVAHPDDGTELVHVCRAEVFELATWLDRAPQAMLAGDLNLTDRQPGYRRLLRGRRDAMRSARAGDTFLGITWRLMAMRIDHMIVPPGWSVTGARAFRVAGSDHRAITAVVGVPG